MRARETMAGRPEPRVRRRFDGALHVRCAEAQADGVPCAGLAADCDCCAHGLLAVWRDGRWQERAVEGREPSRN